MANTASEIEAEIRGTFTPSADPLPADGFITKDEFRDFNNNPEGIRGPHAVDAAAAAAASGSYERFDLELGDWIALALAPVSVGKPYTMLLDIIGRPGEPPVIVGAWRLYDVPQDTSPVAAFALFIASFGHEFTVGSTTKGRFVAKKTTGPGEPGIGTPGPPGAHYRVSAMGVRRSGGEMEWAWCFAIDLVQYRDEVRRRR